MAARLPCLRIVRQHLARRVEVPLCRDRAGGARGRRFPSRLWPLALRQSEGALEHHHRLSRLHRRAHRRQFRQARLRILGEFRHRAPAHGKDSRMTDAYDSAGYGAGKRVGFGEKAGIVVVDLQTGFTDPAFPLGRHQMVHSAVANTAVLLKAARATGAPVANIYTAYSSERDAPYWKIETVVKDFHHGKPGTELDPRIYDKDYDAIFCKTG